MSQIYSILNDVKTDVTFYEKEELTDIEIEKMKRFIEIRTKKREAAALSHALHVP